jgi:hypothetical protein
MSGTGAFGSAQVPRFQQRQSCSVRFPADSGQTKYVLDWGMSKRLRRRAFALALLAVPIHAGGAARAQSSTALDFLKSIYEPYKQAGFKGQPYGETERFFVPDLARAINLDIEVAKNRNAHSGRARLVLFQSSGEPLPVQMLWHGHILLMLPLRHEVGERAGPIAKQWEGEVAGVSKRRGERKKEFRHLSLPAQARVPSLSPRV